jgi:Family of unknown function (DUF6455)
MEIRMTTIRLSQIDARADLARRAASHRLFHKMLSRQEIDLTSVGWAGIEESVYRALHNCAHCTVKGPCASWLAGADAPARYVLFCPNSETLEMLRIMTS